MSLFSISSLAIVCSCSYNKDKLLGHKFRDQIKKKNTIKTLYLYSQKLMRDGLMQEFHMSITCLISLCISLSNENRMYD